MNIWANMMTALRGGLSEAGESIVDGQALRILDQEVRVASEALTQSKESLAEIMAHQKVAQLRSTDLTQYIKEHEGYVVKALEQGNEKLAYEVAEKIADFENQFIEEQEAEQGFSESAGIIRSLIQKTEGNLKRIKQQVDTVKANDNVQRAQTAVAERHSGSNSKMRTAMDSLERIKEKQALKSAHMAAVTELADENADDALQSKLEAAGITSSKPSAADILERLKKKNK